MAFGNGELKRGGGVFCRPGQVSADKHAQRRAVHRPPAAAVNVGQADPFGPVRVVAPADKGEHAAAENYAVRNIDETDDRSHFERETGPAIPFDGLTDHNDHGTVIGGLGDRHDLRGGRVLRNGSGGGGFLRGGVLFRLNLTFSAENRGHRVTIRLDIFA